MKWYKDKKASEGIVISSRVRLARNLEKYPFPRKCDAKTRKEISDAVRGTFEKFAAERFNYIDMAGISSVEKTVLLEDHLISPEFSEYDGAGRLLVTDEERVSSVMINEEDHIRIQCVMPGLDLTGAWKRANAIDDVLSGGLKFAFDEKLGYLTSCPTNLGTGMRASVMLHLPAITSCGQIRSVISLMTKIGLTVRGLYGEGSEADGCLYQISNQVTLGISEKDAIEKLTGAIEKVVEHEKQLRETLVTDGGVDLEDSICRSYGILKYAKKLSSKEFLKLWSDVRFGVLGGIIKDIDGINLTRLLIEVMPGHILEKYENCGKASLRDAKRCEIIGSYLGN